MSIREIPLSSQIRFIPAHGALPNLTGYVAAIQMPVPPTDETAVSTVPAPKDTFSKATKPDRRQREPAVKSALFKPGRALLGGNGGAHEKTESGKAMNAKSFAVWAEAHPKEALRKIATEESASRFVTSELLKTLFVLEKHEMAELLDMELFSRHVTPELFAKLAMASGYTVASYLPGLPPRLQGFMTPEILTTWYRQKFNVVALIKKATVVGMIDQHAEEMAVWLAQGVVEMWLQRGDFEAIVKKAPAAVAKWLPEYSEHVQGFFNGHYSFHEPDKDLLQGLFLASRGEFGGELGKYPKRIQDRITENFYDQLVQKGADPQVLATVKNFLVDKQRLQEDLQRKANSKPVLDNSKPVLDEWDIPIESRMEPGGPGFYF